MEAVSTTVPAVASRGRVHAEARHPGRATVATHVPRRGAHIDVLGDGWLAGGLDGPHLHLDEAACLGGRRREQEQTRVIARLQSRPASP